MSKRVKQYIKKINNLFSAFILTIFYVCVIPFGKLIFAISSFFSGKSTDTYWQAPDKRKLDISSPY